MENAGRWYFTKEILENTPSRKCGIDSSKELSYRQQAANFIQDMGQRLQVTQLCINTAIVYMHRVYMFHSFTKLHRNQLAVAALFLAAKVEEQPRKLEHVVRVAHKCLHKGEDLDPKSEHFLTKCSELVSHENMMLQTLGFDIAIDHPHTYVVKLLQLVRASKDLAQTSYFMATNSLHLTTMCLQYKPTVVACVCIHLACKWSNWKIEPCSEGKEWYFYVDKSVTPELLEELTKDFLAVLEKSPNRLKRRVGPENNKDGQSSQSKNNEEIVGRVEQVYDVCIEPMKKDMSPMPSTSSASFDNFLKIKDEVPDDFLENPYDSIVEPVTQSATLKKPKSEQPHSISLAVYREKQEKKQLEHKALLAVTTAATVNDFPPPPVTSTASAIKPSVPEKLLVPKPEKPIMATQEMKVVTHQEKRLPHKMLATSNELVPQRIPDKSNHKNLTSSSHLDAVPVEKINHLIPKATVAPMPQVNHQPPPKVSVVQPTVKVHPRKDLPKIAPEVIRTNDPFVLLTRVDQSQYEKQIPSDTKPGQQNALPLNASSKGNAPPSVQRTRSRHAKPEPALTNWGKDMINADGHSPVKHKSRVSVVLQNNHSDIPHSTQGVIPKQSPSWDPTKANGSKIPEQPAVELPFPYMVEPSKPIDKPVELHNKHERREKHKHKHSVHSSKDKTTNHVSDSTPDHGMPGSIKITIPKDKLMLSGIRPEGSQKNASKEERGSLKIKIKPPPPVPETSPISVAKVNSGSSLKLVITKDKNAGSYSASRKAERASRKRDRSPSSKVHISRSSGKSAKYPKVDGVANTSLPNPNSAHLNIVKQSDLDVVYNNLAQQPYVIPPCNPQPYFQPFCPYPMAPTNPPYGFPPPLPPQSHSTNSAPPLPRDPPPPLPPQPPST